MISTINNKRVYGIVCELIESLELKKYLRKDESSLKKVDYLLEKIEEMEEEYIKFNLEKYTLKKFLEQVSIFIGSEENKNENKVRLMTIHQSKGLEFKYVFVVGLEEGFYPIYVSNFDLYDEEIEEERRILYVAITRAKTNCYLSYANFRQIGDTESKRMISRFVNEINNPDYIQVCQPPLLQDQESSKISKKIEIHYKNKNEKNNKKDILNSNVQFIPKNKYNKNNQISKIKKNKNIGRNETELDRINNIISIEEKEEINNNKSNLKKIKNKDKKDIFLDENLINEIIHELNIQENNFENKMLSKKRANS